MKIQFDNNGRMKYCKKYHPKQYTEWEDNDLAYLASFWNRASRRELSFAIGRSEAILESKFNTLKRKGLVEYYKKLWEDGRCY